MAEPGTDPRTGLVELTTDECWELLESTSVGRVAVSVGTTPDIFPVNHFVRDREIIIHTEAGTKLAAATMMPGVAFEIDDIDPDTRSGWSVVVKGHGREPALLDEMMQLEDLAPEPWLATSRTRWIVITPREVTGRRVP